MAAVTESEGRMKPASNVNRERAENGEPVESHKQKQSQEQGEAINPVSSKESITKEAETVGNGDQSVDLEDGGGKKSTCIICKKTFSSKPNMYKHQRNVHNMAPNLAGNCRCPETNCEYSCQLLIALRAHLVEKHGKEFEEMKISFLTWADFIKWKTEEEKQTKSRFVSNTGIKRQLNGKEKKYYTCHRSGVFVPRGSGKKKMKTQGTCRIGRTCTASMEMEKDSSGVHVIYNRTHMGHSNAVGYLTLTDEERTFIAGKLLQGATFDKILEEIKDNNEFGSDKGGSGSASKGNCDSARMLMLKRKDLHNISREFNLMVHQDKLEQTDTTVVSGWVERCKALGELSPVVYVKYRGSAPPAHPQERSDPGSRYLKEDDFMLVLMSAAQRALFKMINNTVCIDSIHGMGDSDVKLVTILVIDEYGAGIPMAFCVSNRIDFETLATFFGTIRERVGSPVVAKTFVSDDSPTYYSAWAHVMGGESTNHLLCTWDVDHIWRSNVCKIGGGKEKQALVYKALRALLLECNRDTFEELLEPFCAELLHDPDTKDFGEYFKSQYAVKPQVWAQCYRVDSDIDTNMYLEGMHHTLEECYLQGKKNQHVDRLLDILLRLVRDKTSERLIKMCKSRHTRRLSVVLQRHRAGTILFRSDISTVERERMWVVGMAPSPEEPNGGDESRCLVEFACSLCPISCKLKCKFCDICIHMYLCSCKDFLVDTNICKHVHAVAIAEQRAREEDAATPTMTPKVEAEVELDEKLTIDRSKASKNELTLARCKLLPKRTLKRSHSLRVRKMPRRFALGAHRICAPKSEAMIKPLRGSSTKISDVNNGSTDRGVVANKNRKSSRTIQGGSNFGSEAIDEGEVCKSSDRRIDRAKVKAGAGQMKANKMSSNCVVKSFRGKRQKVGKSQNEQLSAKLQILISNAASKKLDKSVVKKMNRKLDLLLKILNDNEDGDQISNSDMEM